MCCMHKKSEQGETIGLHQLGICLIWNAKYKQPLTQQTERSNKVIQIHAFSFFLAPHYLGEWSAETGSWLPETMYIWPEMFTEPATAWVMLPWQPEPGKTNVVTGIEWEGQSYVAY